MANQTNQNDQSNSEHSSFYDQADTKFNKAIENAAGKKDTPLKEYKMEEGVTSDDDEKSGEIYDKHYMNRAEAQVRENEDASLQDDTYSFDEDNTADADFHDVDVDDFDAYSEDELS